MQAAAATAATVTNHVFDPFTAVPQGKVCRLAMFREDHTPSAPAQCERPETTVGGRRDWFDVHHADDARFHWHQAS